MPTYLITGVSSGIGLELCKQLAARGDTVYGTVRKTQSSMSGEDQVSSVAGVTLVEGIDVAQDDVGPKLLAALEGVKLDVVIHNAGSLSGSRDGSLFEEQKFDNVSMDCMRAAFEVNTLGPLRVQQAVTSLMGPGGKVAVISTGLGSIGDNNDSGGIYAYRTSKAGVNMVTKNMSCEFKPKGIAVLAIAPGFVQTEFGGGLEMMGKMGGKPVGQAGAGILKALDELTMEGTGKFLVVDSETAKLKDMPW